jgi:cellulose synthase/poly-beta-1,6-N-acetylglucosamine synthase-like glycosyltransferase
MLILLAIPTLFMLFYAGYLWWSFYHFNRFPLQYPDSIPKTTLVHWDTVSVIVPARNEEENIGDLCAGHSRAELRSS